MHKSRIGNGLILGGLAAAAVSAVDPFGVIWFSALAGGFLVGFLCPIF